MISCAHHSFLPQRGGGQRGGGQERGMEVTSAVLTEPLGLLLLPLVAMLLTVLCVRCRELRASYGGASEDRSQTESSILFKPQTLAPWPPSVPVPYPSATYPPPSQPDLLHIQRSPQPPGGSHRMPSSRQDSDGANSVASYENQEPPCEDADEDDEEDDYRNEGYGGYVEVLPDSTPATGAGVPSAPVPSNPGLRDSAFSMESREYVNVSESEESTEASLDGSLEYVNVSQELHPVAGTEPASLSSPEVEDEEEEEEVPDYENVQELS
ncbi:PREDICTED: linker for activation of T-cells family member 1 isoform X2 [Chinchilla lanigera]|uniref:Linker for activation of T cells n=1 Tax=Chinchilla lanigera TaxID=34839 RepID=A0A8C2VNQ2_CHILA|nr:PREDICTED: linker for activation of T-cells family member 1 isoform X2 [Chinchilla lanigera]